MFNITHGKGFHVEFANGRRISVQWGAGNYGDNKDAGILGATPIDQIQRDVGEKGSKTAEVMLSGPSCGGNGVKGYCKPEDVAAMFIWAAAADVDARMPFDMDD